MTGYPSSSSVRVASGPDKVQYDLPLDGDATVLEFDIPFEPVDLLDDHDDDGAVSEIAEIDLALGEADALVHSGEAFIRLESADSYEWDLLDDTLSEFDEAPPSGLSEVTTEGSISRRDRAFQEALQLGLEHNWDRRGIELLADVFEHYSWSTAKIAMRRELEAGLRPEELDLALAARRVWAMYPEFSESFRGVPHPVLTWPVALRLVRSFRQYPDVSEIETILVLAYDEWTAQFQVKRIYGCFLDYVRVRFPSPDQDFFVSPGATLGERYAEHEDDFFAGAYAGFNTRVYNELEDYGLVPDIWFDRFRFREDPDVSIDYGAESKTSKKTESARGRKLHRPTR